MQSGNHALFNLNMIQIMLSDTLLTQNLVGTMAIHLLFIAETQMLSF